MTTASLTEFLAGEGPATALAIGDVTTYRTGAAVRRLPGDRMRTLDGLYDLFAAAWDFPGHFGHNKDAFDDCMGDLPTGLRTPTGARATALLTVVSDAGRLLADAPEGDFEWFATSPAHWRERLRRSGRRFGLVLLTSADDAAAVAGRWEGAGAPLMRLRQD
ncbi:MULTISPECIES: barstar family protein [Gordonia]|uniref:Barstar (barnase inhibitor) domain-containing protein n=1 Tax=Gordonia cholesterolivorans TaxID=559625 RepID=A0ABP5UR05_9ACTN|nr:barstar family protein [Gordonia sihwensis]KJR03245.1 hypothetical protein UG54_18750 [Gordonia sihwensis]MBY4570847.1 hypothetical protein [Gordonia sihwensis]